MQGHLQARLSILSSFERLNCCYVQVIMINCYPTRLNPKKNLGEGPGGYHLSEPLTEYPNYYVQYKHHKEMESLRNTQYHEGPQWRLQALVRWILIYHNRTTYVFDNDKEQDEWNSKALLNEKVSHKIRDQTREFVKK